MEVPYEAPGSGATEPSSPSREARRRLLERRLEDGYRRIDEAALAGGDVTEWESFWIKLLAEYEDVCREHDLAA
jgi:hypothetical protein